MLTSRLLVIDPLAESPSVMNMLDSSLRSFCIGIMYAAVAQLAVVQIGLLGTLTGELCHASHCLSLALTFRYLLLHHLSHVGMYVQIVVHFELHEVAYVLVYAFAFGCHLQRTELNLGLTLKHRLLNIDGYGCNQTVTNVGELIVLAEKVLDGAGDVLLERALMSSALSGMLSVDKRVIFFAILIGMCEGYLYVFALHVNDRIKGVDGHCVGEQVGQSVARKDAMAVRT